MVGGDGCAAKVGWVAALGDGMAGGSEKVDACLEKECENQDREGNR